jgi:thiol-disulfide isomerase/thioredoxin
MPPSSKKPGPYVAPEPKNTGMIVVIVVAAVAVLALIAAVVISQVGGDDDSAPAGTEQTQPVVVEGEPLPLFTGEGADQAIGMVPPVLEGRSFDGSSVVIDPGDGTPKVVVLVTHWCPHCQAEVPRIVEWQQQGLIPDGVEVYGVSTSVSSERENYPPSTWLEREGWTFPTIADSEDNAAGNAWGLQYFPYFVALDAEGKVVARTTGELTQEQFTALVGMVAPQ